MENVFKIIYDKTKAKKIIGINDIENILALVINEKCLNYYIKNINVQSKRSNYLVSYSVKYNNITIYSNTIEKMKNDLNNQLINIGDFDKLLYINLLLLQIVLHEIEHANQQKELKFITTLESFIIKLSYLVTYDIKMNEKLYECSPEERFAEIRSMSEVAFMINYIERKSLTLERVFELEKLKRYLRGYHFQETTLKSPIIEYFSIGRKEEYLDLFNMDLNNNERLYYGFPITITEYCNSMKKIIQYSNKYYSNNIIIK